jgi:hypothetical protein
VQKRKQCQKGRSADVADVLKLQTAEEQLAVTREKADGHRQAISDAYRSYEELELMWNQTNAKLPPSEQLAKLNTVEGKIRVLEKKCDEGVLGRLWNSVQ